MTSGTTNTSYCDFKSSVFSNVTIWNNIKLEGNITFYHKTK